MRRIDTDDFLTNGLSITNERERLLDPMLEWDAALLTAHIERESGPDLRVLRAAIEEGAAHRVAVEDGAEEHGPQSVLLVDEDELILALSTGESDEGDASIMVGFEVTTPTTLTASAMDDIPLPPVVLRNYTQKVIYVLSDDGESADLQPGKWTLHATAVPGGADRMSLLQFSETKNSQQDIRKRA